MVAPYRLIGLGGFVRAERDYLLDAAIDGGVDDVGSAEPIGFYDFDRAIFRRWHLLEGCSIDHDVDSLHRLDKVGPGRAKHRHQLVWATRFECGHLSAGVKSIVQRE